jgi:hypothetical protein
MKFHPGNLIILLLVTTLSCNPDQNHPEPTASVLPSVTAIITATDVPATATFTVPSPTDTPLPSETTTPSPSPIPVVESLKAKVSADLLTCRYGPGAEYLYLYALRAGANIKLIGRTDANNWLWVDGTNKCWVNSKFLDIAGDWKSLPVVYPGIARLPITPYYPAPSWANAIRKDGNIVINWESVPISPGKYEDENMHQYIVEVWRCEKGQILFETLGTNLPYITIPNDEADCSEPSHATVWLQEKHGFAGPVEVPWPAQ